MSARCALVTGASGQLGSAVVSAFSSWRVIAPAHAALDISRPEAVAGAVADARPDVVVNCAAFNDVDGAEDRPLDAFALNAFAVRSLARAAEAAGATLVHFSTDFVFDGTASEPYGEHVRPAPCSTYAASKFTGELFALDAPRAYVLRVESLFGTPRQWRGRRGSLESIVDGLEHGRPVRVFSDRVVSPGYIHDIARATRHLVETDAPPGLYHCANAGADSWATIAREAARLMGADASVLQPVKARDTPFKAARPLYSALSTDKLAAAGFVMPHWRDALARWLRTRSQKAGGES